MTGRRTEIVIVPNWPEAALGNRDAGKQFLITEMDALKAERWAMAVFLAVKGNAERIPFNAAELGMVGVAIMGLNILLQADVKEDRLFALLDEMMTCVQIIRNPAASQFPSPLLDNDIQEPRTVMWLRSEVLRVHTGFSATDALSKFISALRASGALPNTSMPPP